MTIAPRYRLPVAIAASAAVVLVVLVAVLVSGGGNPVPTAQPSPTASSSADPGATPEGAARSFFEAFARARRTDDATLVRPFVTGEGSDAYISISAFLQGQKDKGKGSVLTVQRLDNLAVQANSDSTATVTFDYVEGGYNIDLKTGQALESPNTLPAYHVTAIVKKVDARWLVDAYTSRQ